MGRAKGSSVARLTSTKCRKMGCRAFSSTRCSSWHRSTSRSTRVRRFTQWANACVHCGVLQGAFFLHAEPDGPFFAGPENFSGDAKDIYTGDLAVQDVSYSL